MQTAGGFACIRFSVKPHESDCSHCADEEAEARGGIARQAHVHAAGQLQSQDLGSHGADERSRTERSTTMTVPRETAGDPWGCVCDWTSWVSYFLAIRKNLQWDVVFGWVMRYRTLPMLGRPPGSILPVS